MPTSKLAEAKRRRRRTKRSEDEARYMYGMMASAMTAKEPYRRKRGGHQR